MELKIIDALFETNAVDANRRAVEAVMSTGTLDRYQERIEPRSFERRMPRFLSNPVLLRDHDNTRQIGHWENIRVTDDALTGTAIFAATADAEEIWRLHRDGHRKAFSVGFITHAWSMKEIDVEGKKKKVRVFEDCELLECSSVAIPANPDALQRLVRAAGFIPGEVLESEDDGIIDQVKALLDGHIKNIDAAVAASIAKHVTADPDTPYGAAMLELLASLGVVRHGDDEELRDADAPEGVSDDSIERQLRELNAQLRRR